MNAITILIPASQQVKIAARAENRGIRDPYAQALARATAELGETAAPMALHLRAAVRVQQALGLFPRLADAPEPAPAPEAESAEEPKPAEKPKKKPKQEA